MAKSLIILFSLVFSLLIFQNYNRSNEQNLNGLWSASGYYCDGKTKNEIIRIYDEPTRIIGVKVTGDLCVPKGDTSYIIRKTNNGWVVEIVSKHVETTEERWDTVFVDYYSKDSVVLVVLHFDDTLKFTRNN